LAKEIKGANSACFWMTATLGLALITAAAGGESLRERIVQHIDQAKSSINAALYEIGSPEIAEALIKAAQRGVRVRVVLDEARASDGKSQADALKAEGVSLRWISPGPGQLHAKFIIFDGVLTATPNYNYSREAARGSGDDEENFTSSRNLIKDFKKQFDALWETAGTSPE
jgi:phosphatidylserine/phosphatidylglycerophosphate/cardiolipin synthase-like enzyme